METDEIIELLRKIDERIGYWMGYALDRPQDWIDANVLSLEIEEAIEKLETR